MWSPHSTCSMADKTLLRAGPKPTGHRAMPDGDMDAFFSHGHLFEALGVRPPLRIGMESPVNLTAWGSANRRGSWIASLGLLRGLTPIWARLSIGTENRNTPPAPSGDPG